PVTPPPTPPIRPLQPLQPAPPSPPAAHPATGVTTPADHAAPSHLTGRPATAGGDSQPSGPTTGSGPDAHPFALAQRRSRRRRGYLAAGVAAVAVAGVVGATVALLGGGGQGGDSAGPATAGPATAASASAAAPPTEAVATPVTLKDFDGWAAGPQALYLADSTNDRVLRLDPATGDLRVIAGTGLPGFSGDGGPAQRARLRSPADVGVDAAGNVYVLDADNGRVRRIDSAGRIDTVVGGGSISVGTLGAEPAPANAVDLGSLAENLAVDRDGDIYLAGPQDVYRVSFQANPAGELTRIAHAGTDGPIAGDVGPTGPATGLPVPLLTEGSLGDIAVDDGRLYATDVDFHRIVVREPDGTVRTVAGTGQQGSSGDGGPATAADLDLSGLDLRGASRIAVDDAGNLYLVEEYRARVRRVDGAGNITPFAGDGQQGARAADGTQATLTRLFGPSKVAVTSDGIAYIADGAADPAILRIDQQGTLTTVLD
ncbi:MAG: hypothetical protein IRZ08_06865, partial [Frankia sp.]|nr:hypothetical protein [Frankia sp.]